MECIKSFFKFTWVVQLKIECLHKRMEMLIIKYGWFLNLEKYFILLSVFVCFLVSKNDFPEKVKLCVFLGVLILWCLLHLVINLKQAFCSIKSFLSTGVIVEIVISTLFLLPIKKIFEGFFITHSGNFDYIIKQLIYSSIFIFLFGVCWLLFSCLANTAVSITANAIIAGVLGILILMVNLVFLAIPENFGLNCMDDMLKEVGLRGYSLNQVVQFSIQLLLTPLLIINGTSIMVCQLKSYWVHKYNGDKQIE